MMKYKMLTIKGCETNYKRRVYCLTQEEKDNMFDTFVLRETIDGQKVYKSCETNKHYIIK